MANRLALVGASVGPWIPLGRMKSPVLKVTHLPEGAELIITLQEPGATLRITSNGEHTVQPAGWAQISCAWQKRHRTICMFQSRKAS